MEEFFGAIVVFILIGLATLGLMTLTFDSPYQKQAIERGFAQYCPHDGKWAWIGECDGLPTDKE